MSATMRVSDFRDNVVLFPKPPPLLNVEARRFPVAAHFSRRTEQYRYVDEAGRKVRQIHKKLPPGGILVFLSTQREIEQLSGQLTAFYRRTRIRYEENMFRKHAMLPSRNHHQQRGEATSRDVQKDAAGEAPDEYGLQVSEYALEGDEGCAATEEAAAGFRDDFDYKEESAAASLVSPDVTADQQPHRSKMPSRALKKPRLERNVDNREDVAGAETWEAPSEADDEDGHPTEQGIYTQPIAADDGDDEEDGALDTLHILPLYSLLSAQEQVKVFAPPPSGKRLCIIATNVAETSITIPGIRYVVDSGRVKLKTLEHSTGASCYRIEWTSQASSEQRLGRAGRTGPGHCYRLYSTAVYSNLMPKHSAPEVLRTPLEATVLMMKQLRIDHVANFPFPSPPPSDEITAALRHLTAIGALDSHRRVTALGSELSQLPVAPRFGRMIAAARSMPGASKQEAAQLVWLTVAAVAVASNTLDIFEHGAVEAVRRKVKTAPGESPAPDAPIKKLIHTGSDFISYIKALALASSRPGRSAQSIICREHGIIHKTMTEAIQLQRQVLRDLEQPHRDGAENDEANGLRDSLDEGEGSRTARLPDVTPKLDGVLLGGGVVALSHRLELLLRKVFATGLIDQVARRASVHECRERGVTYTDGKATKVPFLVFRTGSIAYLHPSSSCAACQPPPEFVAYTMLQKSVLRPGGELGEAVGGAATSGPRTFMKGATALTKQWLDDIGFDEESAAGNHPEAPSNRH
jgi:ATP-dependent RNA helicase DHX37/DHR1